MQTNSYNILDLIPQAPPFVMVDALTYSDELISRSEFTIKTDNCLVENGCFSEGGLLENIAQTAAARSGYEAHLNNQPVKGGYIGAVKDMEVYFLPVMGKTIVTEIKVENHFFNVSVISGNVWCDDKIAARCEMKVFLNEEV